MQDVTPSLNGLITQGVDSSGVAWSTSTLDGWWESTETTGKTYQKDGADGGWIDPAFRAPRTLVLAGLLRAPSRVEARNALSRLNSAIPLSSPRPLTVIEDGLQRYTLVRQEHRPIFKWESDTLVSWNVQLSAPDPRRLSGSGSGPTYSASTGLPVSTGGLQVPRQAPLQVQATTVSGSVTVTNAGDETPPVAVTISGPAVNPVIRSSDGGLMKFSISIDAGQTLVVDLDRRTVKLNGAVSRRNAMSGSWIVPAAGTVLSFDASSYNSAAQFLVQWSDAWS